MKYVAWFLIICAFTVAIGGLIGLVVAIGAIWLTAKGGARAARQVRPGRRHR